MTKHCWHVTATFTRGFEGGYETRICCHCGKVVNREWINEDDAAHGKYVPVHNRKFQPSEMDTDIHCHD